MNKTYKITGLSPMLETHDMQATIDFYTKILGFECESFSEDMTWASLVLDYVNIMFSAPNEHRNLAESVMSGSLYMNTSNVDAVWEKLKHQCKICYPLEDFEYGMREFAIFDNNGYLLQFGQSTEEIEELKRQLN